MAENGKVISLEMISQEKEKKMLKEKSADSSGSINSKTVILTMAKSDPSLLNGFS